MRLARLLSAPVALLLMFSMIVSLVPAPSASAQSDPIKVVTTIGMIADAVRNIGGDRVEVNALMGPGIDPHLYKPTAGDVGLLNDADIIFYGGLELEGRMTDTLVKIARSGKPTVPVTENVDPELLREPPEFAGKYDPHVWFSVPLWISVVETVGQELSNLSPDDAATFQANTEAYVAQLNELDTWIREQVELVPEDQRVLITAHDAFGYFGDEYGFEVHGIQGVSTASEASASDIQELAAFIAERQIRAIFVESSVPPATIEAVQAAARSRGWDVAVGEPLFSDAMGEDGTPEGTYVGMVTHNVNAIVSALSGE